MTSDCQDITNNICIKEVGIVAELVLLVILIIASIIDYNVIIKFSTLAYIILIVLLIGVLFTEPIGGATSWFKITESISFQPSEIGKIITILFLSFLLNKLQVKGKKEINKIWKLFVFFMFALIPVLLIVKEPDYGTAAVYMVSILFMMFVSGIDKRYIIIVLIIAAIAIPIVYNNLPTHALKRIEVFLNPDSDPRGAGYNIIQSMVAFSSGGFFGAGFGNSKQKLS